MLKRKATTLAAVLCMLLCLSACGSTVGGGDAAAQQETERPPIGSPENILYLGSESNEKISESVDFELEIDLAKYDNPYFDTEIKNGRLSIEINFVDLWSDYVDIDSKEDEEKEEAERREALTEQLSEPRSFSMNSDIEEIFELPCLTSKDGGDAHAIIKTDDGSWYYLDLIGEADKGKPGAEELSDLNGLSDFELHWGTTSKTSEGKQKTGDDYIFAIFSDGSEVLLWSTEETENS